MKEELASLLEKYYNGQTTPEEEKMLREEIAADRENFPEKEIFAYYNRESKLPDGLEEEIFRGVEEQVKKRSLRFRIYRLTSAAAVLAGLITLLAGYQSHRKSEQQFLLMEQALYQVSNSLQPGAEEPEMLVLWVDDNVEIIVN